MSKEVYALKYDLTTKKITSITTDMFENSVCNAVSSSPEAASEPEESVLEGTDGEILIDPSQFPSYPPIPGPSTGKGLGTVIGTDNRVLVKDPSKSPYYWIFCLDVIYGNVTYSGTGFAIGNRVIMTCAHLIYNSRTGIWADRVKVSSKEGSTFRFVGEASGLVRSKLYESQDADDWGFILLPSSHDKGYMGDKWLSSCPTEEVSISGFPGFVKGKATSDMWTERGKLVGLAGTELSYTIDTSGGNSGSPIHFKKYKDIEDAYACGVHCSGEDDMNYGRVIDKRLFQFINWLTFAPNFDHELFGKRWKNYYSATSTFEFDGKTYLFGHTSHNNRWSISEFDPVGKNFEKEVSSGNWHNFYPSVQIFTYEKKLYMFAQSNTTCRWFVSEFNTSSKNFETELCSGFWNNYYPITKVFYYKDKPYLFGLSKSKWWFVSKFDTFSKNFETELCNGSWYRFYDTVEIFEAEGAVLMLGQSKTDKRWFVSRLNSSMDFEEELANGYWKNYYEVAKVFHLDKNVCLFAHSSDGNLWFTSRYDEATHNFESRQDDGRWKNFYGVDEIFTVQKETFLFGQAEERNRSFVAVCEVKR